MGYNQHQSFFLRERWLGKGLKAIKSNPRFFFEDDAFEKLGLGKNMVQSLQHWLIAIGSAKSNGTGKNRILEITPFGNWILKNDISLKYDDSLAMIHYNLIFSEQPSTSWYWLFNIYEEDSWEKEHLFEELKEWVKINENRKVSENSLKRDIDCLLRMYSSEAESEDPEEVIVSPLARLMLLKEEDRVYRKSQININSYDYFYIKYLFCKYSNEYSVYDLSLNELVNEPNLLGKSFNLSSSEIVKILSELELDKKYKISFTRTNNLDIIKLPNITLDEFFQTHRY